MFAHRRARETPRARDGAQVAAHERHAGALHRDVGAGAHRDADLRARQRGRVVDAVARHRDDVPARLQPRDQLRLLPRQHLGVHLVDAESRRDRFRRRPVIAGEHHDAHAVGAQQAQRLGRRRLHGIRDREHAREAAVDRDEERRRALGALRFRGARRAVPRRCPPRRAARDCRARRGDRPRCPTTPRPARASKSPAASSAMPRSRAAASTAAASGCSLARSSPAAARSTSVSSKSGGGQRRRRVGAGPR